jgi:hypothetical protein
MKAKRVIAAVVAALFFYTLVMPAALAKEPGDELAEIFQVDVKPPVDLLPEGVVIVEGFEPGQGTPIGAIKKVKGQVVTIHIQGTLAYPIKEELPLFAGDMLISGEGSSMQALLNDRTVFSLAPYSKMVLDRFLYDPDKAERTSLINLLFGKARFIASKLAGHRDNDFSVTTPAANLGVRGSDFALSVVPVDALSASRSNWFAKIRLIREAHARDMGIALSTTVVTGEETTIGFAGTVGPEQTVAEFSASRAISGMEALVPLAVTAAVAIGALTAAGPGLAALFGAGAGTAIGGGIGTGTMVVAGAAAAVGVAAVAGGGGATTTTTLPAVLLGMWDLHGKCINVESDVFVIRIQINESSGGGFSGSGTGRDYNGQLMDVTISGNYNPSTNVISGTIMSYYPDYGYTRVDNFSTQLAEDTGYFPITCVSNCGCDGEARLVKQ